MLVDGRLPFPQKTVSFQETAVVGRVVLVVVLRLVRLMSCLVPHSSHAALRQYPTKKRVTGFPRLLESSGFFFFKTPGLRKVLENHFGPRKSWKIVATRCHILRLKCTKFNFGGLRPRPRLGELTTLPQIP